MNSRPLFTKYLKELSAVAMQGDAREESFYPVLKTMLEEAAKAQGRVHVHVTALPKPTDAGNPDFRLWNGTDRIIGYVEAKKPTEDRLDVIACEIRPVLDPLGIALAHQERRHRVIG